jgi:hypothetical protein
MEKEIQDIILQNILEIKEDNKKTSDTMSEIKSNISIICNQLQTGEKRFETIEKKQTECPINYMHTRNMIDFWQRHNRDVEKMTENWIEKDAIQKEVKTDITKKIIDLIFKSLPYALLLVYIILKKFKIL